MTCESVGTPGGTFVVCTRGKRWPMCSVPGCGARAPLLCDFPIAKKKSGTCDAKLCERHAVAKGPDRHFCPPARQGRHLQRQERTEEAMSAYRSNAFKEPTPAPVPKWWRRLWDELRAHVIHSWCDAYGHKVAHHTTALGWCARCRAPMAWVPAKGSARNRNAWERIDGDDWRKRHEMSIACGFDKGCAQRMREDAERN